MGCRVFIGNTRVRAHQMAAIIFHLVALVIFYRHHALTVLHCRCHGIFQTFQVDLIHHDLIHHDLDVVHLVAVNAHPDRDLPDLPVYPGRNKTILPQVLEQFPVMPFTSLHHGRQQKNTFPGEILLQQFQYLLVGIFHHPASRFVGISHSRAGVQQTQKVINLRGRPYRGTRILVCRLLLDRDHRAQSRDLIHVRTFHSSQETACISRKSFQIPSLPFGIDCVKRQRRFTTTAQAGNDRQFIAGNG